MALKIGIVGLPNAGKSTLFNALVTKPKAGVGKHPFTTIEKNIGVVNVPDNILFQLAKIENIAKVTPATITFIDIAGLIKDAHQGEGLGNQFLHHIREVDLILHLVRFFQDTSVPHVHPKIDPEDDIEIVRQELILADLQTLQKRLEKKPSSKTDQKLYKRQTAVIQQLIKKLDQGIPAREINLSNEEKNLIKDLNLLTIKPELIIANISETELKSPQKTINQKPVLSVCAKLESELADLPWVEQQQFFKTYGLKKSAKENIIKACYKALDTITFYTIAKKTEARAWPIAKETKAVEAAAKIHTDFAKHFIKAEVINADHLISIGSWEKALSKGAISIKGKNYLVKNGDVIEFKVGVGKK